MANKEQLMILKQGVKAWNQWRKGNPDTEPDLRDAQLNGAKLKRVNLEKADLSGADLSGADLTGGNLTRANLREANFTQANLHEADLSETDLFRTNLFRTNLFSTNLVRAHLDRANLIKTNLTSALLGYTTFASVDLSSAEGIEMVLHGAPSTIGIDTIYSSQGKIPEIFLRGAGVPDNFIEYMHSLVGTGFKYYSCFISYSTKDQEFADTLHADLQAKGVRCWLASEDLKIGDPFRQRIDDAIRFHDKLLVVLSKTSVASSWVESEVEAALEREREAKGKVVLFPIRLDEAVMKTKQAWAANIRRQRHMGDFRDWQDHNVYKKAFERLLRDLKGAAGSGPA